MYGIFTNQHQLRRCIRFVLGVMYVGLLFASLAFQYALGTAPCLLCLLQRGILVLMLLLLGVHLWRAGGNRLDRFYQYSTFVLILIGIVLSIRHIWLQMHPMAPGAEQCLPDLATMLHYFSVTKTISIIANVTGQCSQVHWYFLGLTIPMWLLVFYLMFMVALGLEWRLSRTQQTDIL